MNQEHRDTLTVRVTSVGFSLLVFAIFKPLGIDKLGWLAYVHLAAIWVLGTGVCYITEAILKYIVRMPAAPDKGVEYIIHRNLWFQLINTPLMALMCYAYFYLAINAHGYPFPFTWIGYLTMLLIIVFCSFIIGLYWRFKFQNRYLAAELEAIRRLNEELKEKAEKAVEDDTPAMNKKVVLSGNTSDSVELLAADLLYIESVGNYVKIYHLRGGEVVCDMLRATSKQMEVALKECPMVVRCHRAFIVNLDQVEKVATLPGGMQLELSHSHDILPVSRTYMTQVKDAFNR